MLCSQQCHAVVVAISRRIGWNVFPNLLGLFHTSIWETALRQRLVKGRGLPTHMRGGWRNLLYGPIRFLHCQWSQLVTSQGFLLVPEVTLAAASLALAPCVSSSSSSSSVVFDGSLQPSLSGSVATKRKLTGSGILKPTENASDRCFSAWTGNVSGAAQDSAETFLHVTARWALSLA